MTAPRFDAFIEYQREDGAAGFIGIETKLSDSFSGVVRSDREKHRRKREYRLCMQESDAPWRDGATDELVDEHNQLWRNHMLVWALLKRGGAVKYAEGQLAVVYHPEDDGCSGAIDNYRGLLRDGDEPTLSSHRLDDIVSLWRPLAGDWLSRFEERYVLLGRSQKSWEQQVEEKRGRASRRTKS